MENKNKKIFAVIIEYDDFKDISEERRLKMLKENRVEWRIYIPPEKLDKLTEYEIKKLEGFAITGIPPIKIRTFVGKDLFPKEEPVLIDFKKQEKFKKRAEKKRLKRSVPLKIGIINTRKKGGR